MLLGQPMETPSECSGQQPGLKGVCGVGKSTQMALEERLVEENKNYCSASSGRVVNAIRL